MDAWQAAVAECMKGIVDDSFTMPVSCCGRTGTASCVADKLSPPSGGRPLREEGAAISPLRSNSAAVLDGRAKELIDLAKVNLTR